jgi:hypothetical protein
MASSATSYLPFRFRSERAYNSMAAAILSTLLGGRPRSLMFGSGVDAFAFPPMSAKSSWCSRSRRIAPPRTFRRAGMSRRPTLFPWSAMTPRPGSAAWTCCAGGLVPFWAKDIKVGFANIKRQGRRDREQAGIPGGASTPALPRAGRQLLRMGEDRSRKATVCDRARRPGPDGAGGLVGKLALAGWRMDAQFSDHHHHTERTVRAAS